MPRLQDWQSRLFAAIGEKKNVPFSWGINDCMMFSADMVEAVTGVDHAADYRGTYTTREEAQAIIESLTGAKDNVGIIDSLFKRIPVLRAHRGDLVAAVISDRGPSIGICAGGGCWFVGPDGLVQYPLQNCITAWRVG